MSADKFTEELPPEGQELEYKAKIPSPQILAREVAAFANSGGGKIIFGVKEQGPTVIGLPDGTPVQAIVKEALDYLQPHPEVDLSFEDINEKRIYIVEVKKYNAPIMMNDGLFYIRKGTVTSPSEVVTQVIRVRLNEEPLTAYSLNIVISALTELHTKFWLMQQRRFTDLIEYAQTHNPHFVKEADLRIGKMAHNSPAWLEFITNHGTVIADALKTVTTLLQTPLQLEAAELENQAKELDLKLREQSAKSDLADKEQNRQIEAQKAALENQKMQLELEDTRLELKKKQLELQEKQLELDRKRVEVALEIARRAVDVFPIDVDTAARAMLAESLLPNILQLGSVRSAELIQTPAQEDQDNNK